MKIGPLLAAAVSLSICAILVGACGAEADPLVVPTSAALNGELGGSCSGGIPCAADLVCNPVTWTCQEQCPSGTAKCPGWNCIDLQIEPLNCGTCGTVCGSEQHCVDGACQDTPCKGFKYCDCGLWVAPEATCPARSCDPCMEGFRYCGCPSGGCLVNDWTCSPQPDECGNGICKGALRACGDGVRADPDAACPGGTRLGDGAIEPNHDSNADGSAEAFQYTATSSGVISVLSVYLDAGSTATTVQLGLYSDVADNPGTLLSQGSIPFALQQGWLTVSVPSVSVTAGQKYWIAILAPEGQGTVHFRDIDDGSATSQGSEESSLTSLPVTWTTGVVWSTSSASAYASR